MKQVSRTLAFSPVKSGAAKFTIQKYYLPSGDSTQLKGVVPDIVLPSINDYISGIVQFGDGRRGIVPPEGKNSVVASSYRIGGGAPTVGCDVHTVLLISRRIAISELLSFSSSPRNV